MISPRFHSFFTPFLYTYLDVYTEMSQIHRLEKKLKLNLMDCGDSSKNAATDYENIERISYPVERLENLKSKCNWLIDNMPKVMQTSNQTNSRTEMTRWTIYDIEISQNPLFQKNDFFLL